MVIENNLEYIKKMAEERVKENLEFRAFLKQLDIESKELDAIVHQIADEVSSQIDCKECANCCVQIKPALDNDDILEFALGLKMPVPRFTEQYLSQQNDNSPEYEFNVLPCPFLKDNLCSNYEHRPKDCRSYPHLHKEEIVFRLLGVVENYSICPIVFNVYEWLKAELWEDDDLEEDDFETLWT